MVTTLPPLFDAATRLPTTMSPAVVSRMMSCPPVVAVEMPAAGELASASVAPVKAELASTSVPTVKPSTSTICTLPDASARAANVTAAAPNRLFDEPPAPEIPVCESSVSVAPVVTVRAVPSSAMAPEVISVRFGVPPTDATLKSPSTVMDEAVVVPSIRPMTIVDASSTKLISVFEMPKFEAPVPSSTTVAADGAILNTAEPTSIVASF